MSHRCRPQNDAPGLRSITIISYANAVLSKSSTGSQYIKSTLWTGADDNNNGGVVKYDLDWVADNWQSTSCDLWEEVQSNNFFWNRFTMRKAMLLGAAFAKTMGDSDSASKYASVASSMVDDIKNHYNGQFILEEVNRQKDAAVICALNDGYADDGIFGPGSVEVANTISQFSALFHQSYVQYARHIIDDSSTSFCFVNSRTLMGCCRHSATRNLWHPITVSSRFGSKLPHSC